MDGSEGGLCTYGGLQQDTIRLAPGGRSSEMVETRRDCGRGEGFAATQSTRLIAGLLPEIESGKIEAYDDESLLS